MKLLWCIWLMACAAPPVMAEPDSETIEALENAAEQAAERVDVSRESLDSRQDDAADGEAEDERPVTTPLAPAPSSNCVER